MRVPRAAMKSIIGRKGATIKKLSQETGARITVEEEEGEEETALLIAGSPAQVCRAKAAVHHIVTESTPVTEQLCVPQRAVGRIIGTSPPPRGSQMDPLGGRIAAESAGVGSDFLSLPFQAIECSLAGIKPAGDTWDEAALAAFQRLTHCARWTPVLATVTSYSQSGLCPRPSVQLFGLHHNQSLDVAMELVRLGHAVPCPQEGPGGDGTPQPVPGAAAETPEPVTAASLESLLLEPQHSPSETPRTPSCLSLSDGVSGGSEDGDGVVTEMRSS
ncbi:tudor and KH domain containing [Columba livia]|uniref:Tudor and KH domain containing n=1 Tax=Columba livia TaxID=8932 RepID=A0A2I0LIG7_COLLI|nr:tudor and KH domain containing [Columba livia]